MDILNTPCKINQMTVRNRLIMTAVHTGFSLEDEAAFLGKRAEGGAGAVTAVLGVSGVGAMGNMTVAGESASDGLAKVAQSVRQHGAKLIVQLFHAGRNGVAGTMADPEAVPVAPSVVPSPIYRQTPKELNEQEIEEIIGQFGKAASVCKNAGVDAVEINCSAGYLLSQFLSPRTNLREDQYGGSQENRFRFPLAVAESVRKAVGEDYPVILRISAGDMLGGYGIEEMRQFVQLAEPKIDAVNVTGGWHESPVPQITMQLPEGGFAFLAKAIKQSVGVPVIACNRINNGETARKVLEEGCADFAGGARAYLIDAEYAGKIIAGKPHRRCIGCNKGCIERVLKSKSATCIFNPEVGKEREAMEHKAQPKEGAAVRRVLIAGGGPAGLEAAKQYAMAGCQVMLCTEEPEVGGLMKYAKKAPCKGSIGINAMAMKQELLDLGVTIRTETRVDGEVIEAYQPDKVIVACGSTPLVPRIPGVDGAHVLTAQQVLDGEEELLHKLEKARVCVIGGGAVGLETAQFLMEQESLRVAGMQFLDSFAKDDLVALLHPKAQICVVEMASKAGKDLGSLRRIVLDELARYGIPVLLNTEVLSIGENAVNVRTAEGEQQIPADYVVLAIGYRSVGKELTDWLEASGKYPFDVIGDAKKVGTIQNALIDAYELVH